MQLGTGRERAEHVERRQIEVERRVTRDAVRWSGPEVPRRPLHKMDHVAVRDDDTLGGSRRARRKEDVSGIHRAIAIVQRGRRSASHVRERESRLAAFRAGPGRVHPPDRHGLPQPRVREQPVEQ